MSAPEMESPEARSEARSFHLRPCLRASVDGPSAALTPGDDSAREAWLRYGSVVAMRRTTSGGRLSRRLEDITLHYCHKIIG